jgi:hypothetical protein
MQRLTSGVRHATLDDLAALLRAQEGVKQDVVVPLAERVRSRGAMIGVRGAGAMADEWYEFRPTAVADGQIAASLGIPVTYLRRTRESRPDLYDANVNGWISGRAGGPNGDFQVAEPDERKMLLRTFLGEPGNAGVLRAVLSDRYGIIDNLDVLTAALSGVQASGTPIEVVGADLTDTKMTLRIACPAINIDASELLKGYRSPFGSGVYDHANGVTRHWTRGTLPQQWRDRYGVDENGVFVGLVITNSEVGGGAFTIVPSVIAYVCTNGAHITKDAMRKVHLGSRLDEGDVEWSGETQRKALELITLKARDAVQHFLTTGYLQSTVDDLAKTAGVALDKPAETIEFVAKKMLYTEQQRDAILDLFIRGGQVTAGGVMQAVTALAQTVADADVAYDLEAGAVRAMELAAGAR